MLIQLPNETWMEILNWLRRRDLISKLDQLWDRQFTPIVQGWLHKYTRNVKIGSLLAAKANGGLHLSLDGVWKEVPIAQVEMPENITSFERITISPNLAPTMLTFLQFLTLRHHPLEQEILAFLHLMRPLFRNVNLNITNGHSGNEVKTRHYQTTIRLLMPLISHDQQIESFSVNRQWLQLFADDFHDVLFNARLLCIWDYEPDHDELLTNWLFTRRDDGQPRTLEFDGDEEDGGQQICTRVRERFLDPARQPIPCPFFMHIRIYDDEQLPIPPVTENVATGEQLTIREEIYHGDRYRHWLITNYCPHLNVNDPEWLARKTAEVLDWNDRNQQRTIVLDFPDDVPDGIIVVHGFLVTTAPEGPFSRMMSTLKRMINNWWMTIFG